VFQRDNKHVGDVLHNWIIHPMLKARTAKLPTPFSMLLVLLASAGGSFRCAAAEIEEAKELFQSGDYRSCASIAGQAIEDGERREDWRHYKIRAELATGEYAAARATLEEAIKRFPRSIRLRWLGETVHRFNGQNDRAEEMLDDIDELTDGASWRYSDWSSRVVLGRFFLKRRVDPKAVLDSIFGDVKKRSRNFPDPYVAAGELAIEKHDYELAAQEYEAALRLDPKSSDILFGLARAYGESDSEKAEQHLKAALSQNPNHIDSLLFLAENHFDAERYGEVRALLDEAAGVNPNEPRVWAYRSVLAHLENDAVGEEVCRRMALAWATKNPDVDVLIGSKLSRKYRFAEGAEHQRRALAMDADHLPAKIALAQDLLRLGQEEQGWELASDVYERDGYNVVAHNLVTLHDRLAGYRTLETEDFLVRMDPHEAAVYGDRVLQLLRRAKVHLCAKYEVELEEPVLVEIFPQQGDFAIRTFGLPGGAGFLGVCFGAVITANSPASQSDHPANWEAVLWHEFCHVVTLSKTNNKMPRWLSEGISVYEEREANASWGQAMTAQYREMVMGDDLTPLSELSGAFLQPKSPLHLQFAYFESSIVVKFLVEKYGLNTLKRILVDLGVGMPINDSLRRYAGSLEALDQEFSEYARREAKSLADGVDWERPEFPATATTEQLEIWNQAHPDNYWGLRSLGIRLLSEKQWLAAKAPLERLRELFPEDTEAIGAYAMLAKAHRELGETKQEREVLDELAARSANAVDAYLRLMQLAEEADDWNAMLANAERMLAVNPLQRAPHRFLANAAEQLDNDELAVAGLRVLALMEPHDPADVHFRLASRLHRLRELNDARLHILQSLEEAPRYRAAHRKLLEILGDIEQANAEPTAAHIEEGRDPESVGTAAEGDSAEQEPEQERDSVLEGES
jgi:tetratricopeptide (TPR) repeat protein